MSNPYQTQYKKNQLNPKFILDGEFGIYQTLRVMREVSLEAAHDTEFCAFIDETLNFLPIDTEKKIERLERLAFENIVYVDDPEEFEYIKSPLLMLKEIKVRGFAQGDCDDHTSFLSAALTCVGISNSILALALPTMGEGFNHVVNVVHRNGKLLVLDTSVKDRVLDYAIDETMMVSVL